MKEKKKKKKKNGVLSVVKLLCALGFDTRGLEISLLAKSVAWILEEIAT